MRICHVIESGATGALEMALLAAQTQSARGHRVLIAYSKRPGAPADLGARVGEGVALKHLRMRPLALFAPAWCVRLARLLARWQPDVLHLHCSLAGFLGRLVAGRRFRGRVLYSPHCIALMHLDRSAPERAAIRAMERLAQAVRPALYLACAGPELEVVLREVGAPVRLLENAIGDAPAARFRRAARPRAGPVVTCARIAPLKDPETFARVCRTVRASRPDIEFEWIGDGDRRARRNLERSGVRVTGWLPRDAALARVARAGAYLSTSLWEGMPVSVLEAMALGVPVVCRRAEWSEAIVRDGETGRLFDDAGTAAEALTADPAWRRAAAEAALAAARERFSQARFAAGLEAACRDERAAGPPPG